jgi:hypothetical protein
LIRKTDFVKFKDEKWTFFKELYHGKFPEAYG